ncbi:NAD-dependent protein deacylase [Pseudoruegeria sp. SK021]|nr:NAD-dependent protein deacylase [Pseudoruegeria sp. SK021]
MILTGAGLSAESGLGTFRDAQGLWSRYNLDDVATPEGFARDPALVHAFYNARRAQCLTAQPNPAHLALARLESAWGDRLLIVTQNVDDLHERAGSLRVLHMHGRLNEAFCNQCGDHWPAPVEMAASDRCPTCRAQATRPAVVWFGETPLHLDQIASAISGCQHFVAIGTSGQVYPAAAFVQEAAAAGATTLELNLDRSDITPYFDDVRRGPASTLVPSWVDEVLGGSPAHGDSP